MITMEAKKTNEILIVEDNPADLNLLTIYMNELSGKPLKYEETSTIAEAILQLNSFAADCILLDLSLPDSFGLDGFESIRKQFPNIPIVICSGSQDESLATEALKAGAQDYLIKGRFDSHLLYRSILYAIERNRLMYQLNEQSSMIKENEERYRLLFENNPHPVWLYDYHTLEVLDANQEAEKVYGFERDEILKMSFRDIRSEVEHELPELGMKALENAESENLPGLVLHRKKDGSIMVAEIVSYRFTIQGREVVMSIVLDITKWKKAEESLLESLREKEVLLQEVHHRVKNNLQIMASLLNLQANYTRSKEVNRQLKDTESRIYSMSLVHNELYNSKNLAEVGFQLYVEKLLDNLWNVYGVGAEISREISLDGMKLEVEQAIPLGMILNEIATNSLKYAFGSEKKGKFFVRATHTTDKIQLMIGDDGKGIPENVNIRSGDTLGFQLIHILSKQLKAKIDIQTGNDGTVFHFTLVPR
ncbi:histidine kinase [Leptospira perolatii]|uniref:histidine kinase n=1 Tax=Leptospira perolatii TaxID=2023191 RepID=A0A2M9ZQN1_9LEPT|nr:histidine kinase dimerization/phosphoacceptor domain -containing protein [Leptospira perolatii]PJZ70550.1 histidine kinase [Leptospira perolatii]PJZ74386.1 histidine kinase [Leptospira perolatii]